MTPAIVSIIIASLSLGISATTAWLTLFRRGRLAMTKPHVVFFGFDDVPKVTAKIFLRGLLYSTAARGQVIEGMFAKLTRTGSEQTFGFWGYGETTRLNVGSGLFVGQTGVAVNHHFVLSVHEAEYRFMAGAYTVEVFARLAGVRAPRRLQTVEIVVTDSHAKALRRHEGVLFELNPDGAGYSGHARPRPALNGGETFQFDVD
ncbi:hypothetical protein CSW64_04370 [Caulobacter mirabilis]|uniref:Uncharacterized protein n=1 Tax=Caulobacter mirabilis TaxID=69666 RepID=A0A2D2AUN1_9CAUL|nr:hypothetical protein CSW64_04370 [Caulobacter mirabilis]